MEQERNIDSVPPWCDAFTRINIGTHQAKEHIPGCALAQANFHRVETRDSPGINHAMLKSLPSASLICHSSNVRIGKRGVLSAFRLRRCEHASGGITGLDIAAVMNGVRPQGRLWAVAGTILDLAFLEHDLDGA
ncbi:hypothetical protein OKW46_001149 [Paraburkholderia sp. WSM4179]|nr:hypothetical protein [Paraburkholderia sp. WSM4179]